MTEFVLEVYVARTDAEAVARDVQRARLGAEELTREGTPVRLLQSIFVPDDETCFLLYEAASAEAVRAAARRAELSFDHLMEAFAESNVGA